jgi:hypothetical protein
MKSGVTYVPVELFAVIAKSWAVAVSFGKPLRDWDPGLSLSHCDPRQRGVNRRRVRVHQRLGHGHCPRRGGRIPRLESGGLLRAGTPRRHRRCGKNEGYNAGAVEIHDCAAISSDRARARPQNTSGFLV